MLLTLIVFLVILSILVLIHEAGHFFTAKKFGIKVEEFGFGFPPRALGIKRGETVYSINWLPIGGFVKLYGEDEAGGGKLALSNKQNAISNKDEGRAFYARSVRQRAIVVVAGVVMNVILAIAIFYTFLFISNFKTDFPLLTNHAFFGVHQINKNLNETDAVVSAVLPGSPAEKAGMTTPFEILSVNGQKITDRKNFIEFVNTHKGKEITIEWRDIKTEKTAVATVVPRVSPPKNEGALGVGFFPVAIVSYDTPVQRAFSGVIHTANVTVYTLDVFAKLFAASVEQKSAAPVSEGVSGPVGIFSLIDAVLKLPGLKEKVLNVLNIAGLLSISLAFFNVLPIPAVDGGRLFFILAEGITGKKINPQIESTIHTIGMAVLMALIALITFRDIARLFTS